MSFFGLKTTEDHKKYWGKRKIDWGKDYLSTWNHPHRNIITGILKGLQWLSLIEIGCGGGANLMNIVKNIPGKQLGGIDVNPECIELAQRTFEKGWFKVCSGDDIMMSDKSTDIVLSDMCLIYVGPRKIHRYLEEIKRLARNYVILCEFHSSSFWARLKLRFTSGYNAYDYKRLLQSHNFYDIMEYRLTSRDWPGGEPQKSFGWIFVAKVPKYV